MELHTVFVLHETSHGPCEGESPALFEEVQVDLLLTLLSVLLEHRSQQVEHLEDANHFRSLHHVGKVLANEVEHRLLGRVI